MTYLLVFTAVSLVGMVLAFLKNRHDDQPKVDKYKRDRWMDIQ